MDSIEKKEFIKNVFNTVSEGYDSPALRFFQNSAEKVPSILNLQGHEKILDVATGTGRAALCLSESLTDGQVIGIDMSEGMLNKARKKAAALDNNSEFIQMDIEQMTFDDQSFDHANCSFGLFFLDDMETTLNSIAKKVKSGGKITSCCFTEDSFLPYVDLFSQRIEQYDVEIPEAGFKRLATEDKSRALYESCNLTNIKCVSHQVGYNLDDANQWWDIIWYAGFRGLVDQIEESRVDEFKQNHLVEVQEMAEASGLRLPVEVIFTVGEVA